MPVCQFRKAVRFGAAVILLTVCVTAQIAQPSAVDVADWHKLDAGPFSILSPAGWEFHQLQGVDSYVGEFVGDGMVLTFDFGRYSSGYFKHDQPPAYSIAKKHIGGHTANVVSPRTPGHGTTGAYFPKVAGRDSLCIWGKELTTTQQELVLRMFETIRFGGPVPRFVVPPPPPLPNKE
jgi:hypothetical protein